MPNSPTSASDLNPTTDLKPLRARRRRLNWALFNFATLLFWWLIEQFVGERFWLSNLLTYLPQQPLILPSLFLLFFTCKARDRRATALHTVSLCFFLATFGGFHLPLFHALQSTLKAENGHRNLRIMTYNIRGGLDGVDKVAQTIVAQKPDILCLQEAEHYKDQPDPTAMIARSLPDYFMVRAAEVTVFSRFPIVNQRSYPFQKWTTRCILETTISLEGKPLKVFNVHLATMRLRVGPPDWKESSWPKNIARSARDRSAQIALLQNVVAQSTARDNIPYLICGDFNTPPRGLFYRRLSSRWNDSFARAGWGMGNSFRSDWPLLRIDYIWSKPNWRARDCFVVAGCASDHRALVADFERP